ncbi:hypothetical protein, partial [Burkholderia sp. SIMBA_019]|uniref:hypothetical protein n=1 Tax=Burkholderia sp. SIMBA_019 TaxID=3085765 RepID=UPI00397DF0F5
DLPKSITKKTLIGTRITLDSPIKHGNQISISNRYHHTSAISVCVIATLNKPLHILRLPEKQNSELSSIQGKPTGQLVNLGICNLS